MRGDFHHPLAHVPVFGQWVGMDSAGLLWGMPGLRHAMSSLRSKIFGEVSIRLHDAKYTAHELEASGNKFAQHYSNQFDIGLVSIKSLKRPRRSTGSKSRLRRAAPCRTQ